MIYINVAKQSNYPISSVKIKKFLQNFFKNHGIVSDAECNVSFVGEAKMLSLAKRYYKNPPAGEASNNLHNVFSFVESEILDFKNVTDVIQLGEIVVCFPVVLKEAKMEGKLIEEKALELIGHSALHLLGIHHN